MSKNIVVVDDEEQVRNVIARSLGKRGYVTFPAATSETLFGLLETHPIDLVILDIELGIENGLDVLARVKAAYPSVSVITLTGRGFDEPLLQLARGRGADGYLSKTLPITELLLAIRRILRDGSRDTSLPTAA